ncbi:MAG: thioredoxin family protein, partial [Cyanobacteria bacterium SZAS LIN-5]|nr:thioredoxin family protein [Cyanobacteria bacterium SZAS LIN-5]
KTQDESAGDGKKAQDESAGDGKKTQDESAGGGKKAQDESAGDGTKTEDESAVVGKTAPDFTLRDTKGQTHQLSRLIGKFVVLEWFNDGCPFVRKHYKSNNMQSLQKEFTGKGVVWYTISSAGDGKQGSHTPAEYNKILSQLSAQPTALLLDPDGKVGHLYQAKTTPDMYVIDKTGKLIYAGAIDDTPSSETDDIPKSTNYVRAALAEALSGKKVTVATTKPYGCSVKYAN